MSITWRGIQPGPKIPARYLQTGLGFSARPNGLKNPCNRHHSFHNGQKKEREAEHAHRLCFRTSVNFRFAPGYEMEHVITTIFQLGGRSEISARAETHHVIRLLEDLNQPVIVLLIKVQMTRNFLLAYSKELLK